MPAEAGLQEIGDNTLGGGARRPLIWYDVYSHREEVGVNGAAQIYLNLRGKDQRQIYATGLLRRWANETSGLGEIHI